MDKKILLAVDASVNSKHAVLFAAKTAGFIRNLTCTLFHVQPHISHFLKDEAKTCLKAQSAVEKLRVAQKNQAEALLNLYRETMRDAGMDEDRIEIRTVPRRFGVAKDVLEFAQEKRYDAIVTGRRGLTKLQEIFSGSATRELVDLSRVIPLWIVDGRVTSDRMLLAVDGSESAFRAVDHVSFVFSGCSRTRITLFHVVPSMKDFCPIGSGASETDSGKAQEMVTRGPRHCIDDFMTHVYKRFADAGISQEQIEVRECRGTRKVGKVIMEEAVSGDYGTVILGRREVRNFFAGSVSDYILNSAARCAIWVVP